MKQVLLLVHRFDDFERYPYVVREMAEVWKEQGLGVHVARTPAEAARAADVAFLHVDLTVTPANYLAAAGRHPNVINGKVVDISKRAISRHLVRRGDGYDGPVIVKTDRNSGGVRERRLADRRRRPARYVQRLRDRLPWPFRSHLDTGGYPVFESAAAVPRAVWFNPALLVERFLPERRDGLFCLRTWVFFADRETNSVSYAREPVIKSANVIRRDVEPHVPDELRQIRRALGFDFGKFDYGIVDGAVVLYDVNRTPMFAGGMRREEYWPRVQMMAKGLEAFL
jgi:hypothetical protein